MAGADGHQDHPFDEEIKAYRNVAGQLEAKLAAKERTAEIAREFAGYCCKVSDAFDTVDIPFERKVQMLSAVRVKVLAHSNGTLKLITNLGALIEVASPKSLDVARIGSSSAQFKGGLTLEFSLT